MKHLRLAQSGDLKPKTPVVIPCILNLTADVTDGDDPTVTVLKWMPDAASLFPVTLGISAGQDIHHLHQEDLDTLLDGKQGHGNLMHLWQADGCHSETGDQEDAHHAVFGLLFGYYEDLGAEGKAKFSILYRFPEQEGEVFVSHDWLTPGMQFPRELACFIPTQDDGRDCWFLSDSVVSNSERGIVSSIAEGKTNIDNPVLRKLLNIIKSMQ